MNVSQYNITIDREMHIGVHAVFSTYVQNHSKLAQTSVYVHVGAEVAWGEMGQNFQANQVY